LLIASLSHPGGSKPERFGITESSRCPLAYSGFEVLYGPKTLRVKGGDFVPPMPATAHDDSASAAAAKAVRPLF
jgi:hypothetical protein